MRHTICPYIYYSHKTLPYYTSGDLCMLVSQQTECFLHLNYSKPLVHGDGKLRVSYKKYYTLPFCLSVSPWCNGLESPL